MPHCRHRTRAPFAIVLIALASMVFPVGNAEAATTIYYNGAGSAPRISIIGDSTIAALRWTNQFAPLRRFNFTYDAESCRRTVVPSCRGREGYTPDTTLNAMRRLSGRLGSVLAIMGGYDDSSYNFGAAVDAVMAEAARQGIPTVMWLTLRASGVAYVGPGAISNSATFRATNRILYQKAIQYGPRLQIADWATFSASHPEWFYSDGIHFRPAGANVAADYIADQAARVLAGQIITPPAGMARPSAPRGLSAAVGYGVGSGRVRLTWQAPSATGGVPLTDYVIQRSYNGGRTWVSLSDGVSTNRTYMATGLANGATYHFRIAARNRVGWSPVSKVIAATPLATIPSSPRSLRATPGSGHVVLNWIAPSSSGGLPITDYVVQRSYNGGRTWVSLSDGQSTNRYYTATGLTNGATYQFRVAARNAVGWSRPSNVVTATPGGSTTLLLATASAPLVTTTTTTTVPVTSTTSTSTTTTTAPTTTTTATAPPTLVVPTSSDEPTTSAEVANSTIGDFVWLDGNGDGLQDENELGVAGVAVVLLDAAGVELDRDVTDELGAYEFAGVAEGSYLIELELPDGYDITLPHQGADDELDSDLVTVDEQRGTARTDLVGAPTEPPLGVDLGLILATVEPEPTTTAAPDVTTTEAPPTTVAPPPTQAPTTQPPTTQPPTTAAPTTVATTTTAPPPTSAVATTTTVAVGG